VLGLVESCTACHGPTATFQTAMYTHLDQSMNEATHRLKGDYAADVKDFDASCRPSLETRL
jgi:hypothetical protein